MADEQSREDDKVWFTNEAILHPHSLIPQPKSGQQKPDEIITQPHLPT
jgi:hypothetical protein